MSSPGQGATPAAPSTPTSTPSTSTLSAPASSTPTPAPTPAPTPTPPKAPTYTYRNGSYTSSASYSVPGGHTNVITSTITVSNDTITEISDSNQAASSESWQYINSFESKISGVVVAQKLGSLSPSRVSGASLTTGGFNAVLTGIRNQAKD